MGGNNPFGITTEDVTRYTNRQSKNGIDNHPLRNTETTTFFQALMSEDADFIKHGFVAKELVGHLGEGDE